MSDTHCAAVDDDLLCTRDRGHGPDHWHEDDRGEIIRHWTTPEGKIA